jgi:hypothetical protein
MGGRVKNCDPELAHDILKPKQSWESIDPVDVVHTSVDNVGPRRIQINELDKSSVASVFSRFG